MSTSGGAGGGAVSTVHVTLNAAAIQTMFSAPTVIVPAPGAGKALAVVSGFAQFKYATIGYSTNAPGVYYGTSPVGTLAAAGTIQSVFPVSTAGPSTAMSFVTGNGSGSWPQTAVANAALTVADITNNPTPVGPLGTTSLAAGGVGYVVNDTGTVDPDFYAGGATYKVLTVDGGGAVLTYQITAPGDGYSVIDNPLPTTAGGGQPGIGTGFTINALTTATPDGSLTVTVDYITVTLT